MLSLDLQRKQPDRTDVRTQCVNVIIKGSKKGRKKKNESKIISWKSRKIRNEEKDTVTSGEQ